MSTVAFSPDPAAVGRDADAGRRRLVRDCGVTVATAVVEDDAHLDGAFIVGAGNVEGQPGIVASQDRRSAQAESERDAILTAYLSRNIETLAWRAAIQPGFLAYQVGKNGSHLPW